jgi:ribose-phosphate pyrophosphokinase
VTVAWPADEIDRSDLDGRASLSPEVTMLLFALGATRAFGARVAERLGIVTLAEHEEREFEDGQHKARPLVSVRGRDVFVLHSLHGDDEQSVNDKLCRLLFFLGAVRDASAASVTAVVPFLCYSRKDRKTKARDPVTTRYVAALFEAMQVDRVVTLDVHNVSAFQNAFRCRTEHLEARGLFVEHLAVALGRPAGCDGVARPGRCQARRAVPGFPGEAPSGVRCPGRWSRSTAARMS